VDINTVAIRRLRDALLSKPLHSAAPPAGGAEAGHAVLRRVEPFAETMFLVMVADEHAAPSESQALHAAVGILTGSSVPPPRIQEMIAGFHARLAASGAEARLARIGASFGADREDREIAFTLAAAIALADDQVALSENRILGWVREYFGISHRRVVALIESIE
jgi:hypothetical protein